MTPPSTGSRRTLLADAALDVLADAGMRGLTHRAVDAAAGLPAGTTSAYFRTRSALLTALVRRLVERDQDELRTAAAHTPPPRTPADLVQGLTLLVAARTGGEGRRRSLARYACVLESVRDPELRDILVPRENRGREVVRDFLAARGVEDPDARTLTLLACVDGLVLDRVVAAPDAASGRAEVRKEIEGLVAAALRT
ncbi:tetR-family transcriptional regulator [Streptomyces laurentii]|uniref:TetR-family transcriptional regulator n=1 Tax=Streptomyces laurentii TaxID=39478 RepID=A0A169PLW4_STRLU|nr:tetR-family transcriptional regulator [Streptomyces laurentii]